MGENRKYRPEHEPEQQIDSIDRPLLLQRLCNSCISLLYHEPEHEPEQQLIQLIDHFFSNGNVTVFYCSVAFCIHVDALLMNRHFTPTPQRRR